MPKDRMRQWQKPENFETQAFEFISQQPERQGQALAPETRSQLEPGFGHSFADVRVFSDLESNRQAQGLEARAFTVGQGIHFAANEYAPQTRDGQALLAHELSHVVQNKNDSGAQAKTGVSQGHDASELEASRASEQVLAGQTAQIQSVPGAAIQRFGSLEHMLLGEMGSGGKQSDINYGTDDHPEFLSYGEMVALAGDHFKSIEQMRGLTTTQAGRDEIRYARWKSMGKDMGLPKPKVDPEIEKKVENDYLTLAADNFSHFSAGGTARNDYQTYHLQALGEAFEAGKHNDPKKFMQATTTEAFGNHYLTDMFSAGHVRTERITIKGWYRQHYPDDIAKFKTYLAATLRHFLEDDVRSEDWGRTKLAIGKSMRWLDGDIRTGEETNTMPFSGGNKFPTQADLEQKIEELAGPALKAFSLGDIVALAIHDTDNQGLNVTSEADTNGSDVIGGHSYRAVGDGQLLPALTTSGADADKGAQTRDMALAAIRQSLAELEQVRAAGAKAAGLSMPDRVVELREMAISQQRDGQNQFGAERFIPKDDISAGNTKFDWQWGSFNDPMYNAVDIAVKGEIANQILDKAKDQSDERIKRAVEYLGSQLNIWGIANLEWALNEPAKK